MREKLIEILRCGIEHHEELREKWIIGGKVGERPSIIKSFADILVINDVAQVVRCKDCKWYRIAPIDNVPYCCHESGYCGEHMMGLFFCACGERKDND